MEGNYGKSVIGDDFRRAVGFISYISCTASRTLERVVYRGRKQTSKFSSSNKKLKIHHIGSTAINEIWAKPIIDILVEIPANFSMNGIKKLLVENGYTCMAEEENRKSFNRGYTNEGFAEKVFHLHLRYSGDNNELYFRDYMNDYSALAKQYEEMKLSLWKKFEYDRDGYTNAKGQFISECTEKAKKEYKNIY